MKDSKQFSDAKTPDGTQTTPLQISGYVTVCSLVGKWCLFRRLTRILFLSNVLTNPDAGTVVTMYGLMKFTFNNVNSIIL